MPSTTNKAENDFFRALLSTGPLQKQAVDLETDTADMLGVPAVSPADLDALEMQAGTVDEVASNSDDSDVEPVLAGAAPKSSVHPAIQPLIEQSAADTEPIDETAPLSELDREDREPNEQVDDEIVAPELPSRSSHGRLFSDKLAHPLQILETLDARYGAQWDDWEPETLWWALRRDFGPVGDLTRNKIGALTVAVNTDMPWQDWDTFENCGLAWNDTVPIFSAHQPMTPMQMAFTVHVLKTIRADELFSNEVSAYIAAILDEHGWVYAPDEWFAGAQILLDRKPWAVGLKTDVIAAWNKVKDVDPSAIDWGSTDPIAIHLLKMHVVQRYLEERDLLKQDIPGTTSAVANAAPPVP